MNVAGSQYALFEVQESLPEQKISEDVPDVRVVQFTPFVEDNKSPLFPTATKTPLPYVKLLYQEDNPPYNLSVQFIPFVEECILFCPATR